MEITRIAFVLGQVSWLGGMNYYRNLLSAIGVVADKDIELVVFGGLKSDLKEFEGIARIVRTSMLDRGTFYWFLSKVFSKIFRGKDYFLYNLLLKEKIDVLSHYNGLWSNCKIKTIGWIPDFQHFLLPDFFSDNEKRLRDLEFKRIIKFCDVVLLSSVAAKSDLDLFQKDVNNAEVLQFVPRIEIENITISLEALQAKYNFTTPFFYVPNQFWRHKNHKVIIDALSILKKKGINILVLTSGSTADARHPQYFTDLVTSVESLGLQKQFRVLGVIPYDDLVALMKYSVALINPSFFEGWSTTVEEAKILGKKIILSNLAVHIEQNPTHSFYFDPSDSVQLAQILEDVYLCEDGDNFDNIRPALQVDYLQKREKFGATYLNIVHRMLGQ